MFWFLSAMVLAVPSDTLEFEIRRMLLASVHIEAVEGRYLGLEIDSLPDTDPAARLVNDHRLILNYLLSSGAVCTASSRFVFSIQESPGPQSRARSRTC